MNINIEVPKKLVPVLQKPKRIKIMIGGRGSGKSITAATAFSALCARGFRLCCAREFQNSISDSVHALIKNRINELGLSRFISPTNNEFKSSAGGEIVFKGLARNVESFMSTFGIKAVWVEEARTLSAKSIDVLLPSIRESGSEIWLTANRGSSNDPFSERFLTPFEDALEENGGYYEDEDHIIIDINYDENPWFPDVLESQRKRDKKLLPKATYNHIWLGRYSDTVDDAIIQPEWFDACIDAHEKLGFKALGQKRVSFDPADSGDDKAIACMHGSILVGAISFSGGTVNEATDTAISYAKDANADVFLWDAIGVGLGLKRDIDRGLSGTKVDIEAFIASSSAHNPDAHYEPLSSEIKNAGTNREVFANLRAQMYWALRDRMYRTWQAVEHGTYSDPDDLISISSNIEQIKQLRSELCRIPRKMSAARVQLLSKQEMKSKGIKSPNMADCVMMCMLIKNLNRKQVDPVFAVQKRYF